jgi:hypothetical protein
VTERRNRIPRRGSIREGAKSGPTSIENVSLDDEREMDALVDQMFTVGLARMKATSSGGKASSIHKVIRS